MIDEKAFHTVLEAYKRDFPLFIWNNEHYKWEALQWFRDHWDMNVPTDQFASMLKTSLKKTSNLLETQSTHPRSVLQHMASARPEDVREMFRQLFDESKDVTERITAFKASSENLIQQVDSQHGSTFQNEHAISVYLWLHNPGIYTIYMYQYYCDAAEIMGTDYVFDAGHYDSQISSWIAFSGEVHERLVADGKLTEMLERAIRESEVIKEDPDYNTLTSDFFYYTGRYYKKMIDPDPEKKPWDYQFFDTGIKEKRWESLLKNAGIFTPNSRKIMRRMKDSGGEASCIELARKYGGKWQDYSNESVALAKRVRDKTGCGIVHVADDKVKYWPILFVGKKAETNEEGAYTWKLRDELQDALNKTDLSDVPLYEPGMQQVSQEVNQAEESIAEVQTVGENLIAQNAEQESEPYSKENFLHDVYLTERDFEALTGLLTRKKNIILCGAPGVGKTFMARRLAWTRMGAKDNTRVESVQFHQNYTYEDFMMGYRPEERGFRLQEGVFLRFAKRAAQDPGHDYYFLIDEINRGNVSRIFGELLQGIETDYRGMPVTLQYTGQPFSVPKNLYLIGMMNTADRSLAMIDYALRRRFGFFQVKPAFDSAQFTEYGEELHSEAFDRVIDSIKKLNKDIKDDTSLGEGFQIGHSYFCNMEPDTISDELRSVINYDILPTLKEYWYDNQEKVEKWKDELQRDLD